MAKIYNELELIFQPKPTRPDFKDLDSMVFSRLTVIGFWGYGHWYCRCECGNITKIQGGSLRSGGSISCGCFRVDRLTKDVCHSKTPTYAVWRNILNRCENPKHPKYKDYGGRGIKVCGQWLKFENFLADMGEKPDGLSLDRIENNKGYCKENCRWATRKQQNNNKRGNILMTFEGATKTAAQWSYDKNIPYGTIMNRIKVQKWPVEKILTMPIRSHKRKVKSP